MTDVLAALWVVLGLEDNASSQLEAANAKMERSTSTTVGKMSGSLTQWRDQVNLSNREMAKWAAAIGSTIAPAAAAMAIAVAEINKFGNIADTINDLSYATGLSTRKIQELQYAATLSNTEFSAVTGGIKLFTLAIAEAKDESSDAARAFAALGVATVGRSYDQIWEDTARAIASVEDETTRAALANTLYGRGWQEMVPYIKDYVDKADEIKGIDYLTPEQLDDLEKSKAELDALGYKLTIFEGQVVSFFAKNEGVVGKWLKEWKSDFVGEGLLSLVTPQGAQSGAGGRAGEGTPAPPPVPTTAADVASAIMEGMSATDAKAAYLSTYTIPKLQKAYDELKAGGVASAEEIDAAYIELLDAKEQLIRLTEEQTESEKELAKAVEEVEKEYKRLDDINKDYARDLQMLDPRDVQGFIDLQMRHKFDVEDQQGKIEEAETGKADLEAAATAAAVAAVRALPAQTPSPSAPQSWRLGEPTPLPEGMKYSTVEEFYQNVMPAAVTPVPVPAAGDTSIPAPVAAPGNMNLPNITITGNTFYLNGDKSFENMLQEQRIRAGVRLR